GHGGDLRRRAPPARQGRRAARDRDGLGLGVVGRLLRCDVDLGGSGARHDRPASPQGRETGMNRLREELGVAPRTGVAASAAVAVLVVLIFLAVSRDVPVGTRIAIGTLMWGFPFVYGFLLAYVFGDARRRGMRYKVWTLVAALVPNALGFLLYFLLREPKLTRCGACGAAVLRDLAFCPQCDSGLAHPRP